MDVSRQDSPSRPAGPHRSIFSGQAPWRSMSPLAREIVAVLVVKAIVLTLLWFAFFRAPVAPHMTMDPERVAERIAAPGSHPEAARAVR
jgi:hypothetical protein